MYFFILIVCLNTRTSMIKRLTLFSILLMFRYASQAIYGSTIAFFLVAAVVLIVLYLRDDGFQLMHKFKTLKHHAWHYCCCACCDTCCCAFCRKQSQEEHEYEVKKKLARASLTHTKTFFGKIGENAQLENEKGDHRPSRSKNKKKNKKKNNQDRRFTTLVSGLNFKDLNDALDDHIESETVWFRPEKFKIMLSFLQVFQEYRRTYRIKWPKMVQVRC